MKTNKAYKCFVIITIFILVSAIPYFLNTSVIGNGFISIGDSDIPLNPKSQIANTFTAIDHRVGFGYSNTNWQLLSKTIPLTVFSAITDNHEVALRLYLAFLSFMVMLGMYTLMSELIVTKGLKVITSILWAFQSQIFFWIIFNPNIVMVYAALPVAIAGVIAIWKDSTSKSSYIKLIIGSVLLVTSDISYAFVSLLGLLLFIFSIHIRRKILIISKSFLFVKIAVVSLLLSQIFISGLVANQIFNNSSEIVNKNYTQGAINSSALRASVIESLRLGLGTANYFGELDENIHKFHIDQRIIKLSVMSAICTLVIGIIIAPQNRIVLSAIIVSIVGLFLSAGSNLPNWTSIYDTIYAIPGFVLVRNMIKFNLLYQIGFFIIYGIVLQRIIKYKRSEKIFPILKIAIILLISSAPMLSTTPYIYKDLGGILKFNQLPNEYYELKNALQNDSNSRIFFYPLKNPIAPESYKWGNHTGLATPYITNLLEFPNNLVIHPDQHPLSIDLMNILIDDSTDDSVNEFFRQIGLYGYKYVIFRNDVLEKPGDNATLVGEIAAKKIILKGNAPVISNQIFTVFETPEQYFMPIVWTSNDTIIQYKSPYSFEIKINPNGKRNLISISVINNHLWLASKPLFNSSIGKILNAMDPILFGIPVRIEYLSSQECRQFVQLDKTNYDYNIGNCLALFEESRENIVVSYWPNIVTVHLKIIGLVIGLIMLKNLISTSFSKYNFN